MSGFEESGYEIMNGVYSPRLISCPEVGDDTWPCNDVTAYYEILSEAQQSIYLQCLAGVCVWMVSSSEKTQVKS